MTKQQGKPQANYLGMLPIFDYNGQLVGWLRDDAILDRGSEYRAYIDSGNVFDYEGRYLGQSRDGYLWNTQGVAVAFIEGAHGGPFLPMTEIVSIPAIPGFPPPRPIHEAPPIPPFRSLVDWSIAGFEAFLKREL